MENKSKHPSFLYILFNLCTAMVGYAIHKSIFWSIIDFLLAPLVWIKWLLMHQVTLDIIKKSFEWFL